MNSCVSFEGAGAAVWPPGGDSRLLSAAVSSLLVPASGVENQRSQATFQVQTEPCGNDLALILEGEASDAIAAGVADASAAPCEDNQEPGTPRHLSDQPKASMAFIS